MPDFQGAHKIILKRADIDARNPIHGDAIYFRESFDVKDLSQAESEVTNAFPNLYGIKLKSVFIVTWFNVTFYDVTKHPWERRNTFQSAIATNGIYSFAIFYYNEITWTTGDKSNGTNGVGGTPAQAGFDAGDGKNRLMLGGSCENEILTIGKRSNVNSPGKWIFRVDSANIETAGCTAGFLPSDILKISPSYVTALGQVAVEVSGPCLTPSSTTSITCRIYDPSQPPFISVKGKIVGSQDSIKVICGIPYLFSIGRMKVELVIFDNLAPISFFNTTYHGFLYVTDSNPKTNTLNIKVNKDSNGTAESTAFSWNPKSFVDGTNFLDMKLIIFDLSKKQPEMQSEIKIGDKIENSGKWIWNFKENGNSLGYQICNQFGIKVVFQAIEFGWDMLEGNDYRSHWIANNEIDGNKFLGDFCDTSIREKLCIDWYLSADNTTTSSTQSCPPTSEKAAVDLRFIPKTNFSTSFYHSGEDICYHSIAPLENGEEQECCYKAGNIDCSFSGGHSQSSHPNNPFKHFSNDILPWILCCYEQDEGICGRYSDKRACDSGINYIPPGIALGIGDPHFHTFDDFFYTFNGFGEFWILENSTSQPLAVQARMEPLNLASQKATIFSGFVFSAPNSAKIQIQKSLIRIVDIFIDDQQLDITSPNSLKQFSINGWQLNVAEDYTEIQIGTNLGFSFKITSFKGAFGILVTASPEWKSKTAGLFGNFNGNKSYDLTSKNGTILDPNSSLQEIHENFGLSWAVTPQTSLFTYFVVNN
uniref:Uncharacterized protein n=1 Tax=Panagrolaimus davidi TaxID=227884 RepID=A0A914PBJ6_9BILA